MPFRGWEAPYCGRYTEALQAIDLHRHDQDLLATNYHAPRRTITAKQMALALGFNSFGAANLHYGKLARRIGEYLGAVPEHAALWVLITMSWPEGECEWTLRPQVAAAIERMGWVGGFAPSFPDEVEERVVEGAVFRVSVDVWERSPVARERCIKHHGCTCVVCGFNFGATYGPPLDGFIHVHHLRPLSEVRVEHVVDPVRDLRPVCPNCHAALHTKMPAYSIEELRRMLKGRTS